MSWRSSRIAILAAATGLVATAAAAQQQVPMAVPGPQQVYEKPRPEFDPVGLRAGAYVFYPSVSVGEIYDDNVFASERNEKDDTITYIAPRLGVETEQGPLTLSGILEGAYSHYIQNDNQDTEEYSARIRGRYRLTERNSVTALVANERAVIARSDVEEGGGTGDPRMVHRTIGSLGYLGEYGPYVVDVNGRARNLDFIASPQRDRDRIVYDGSARVGYRVSRVLMPFVEPRFEALDYDEAVDFGGVDRDADRVGGNVGVLFEIPERWWVEGAVGVSQWSFDAAQFDNETVSTVSGVLGWNPIPTTTVKAGVLHDSVATTSNNSSLKTIDQVSLGVEYEFRADILGFAEAEYRMTEFLEGTREDDDVSMTVGGDYLLNRNFVLSARYTYSDRDSNVPGEDFGRNVVWLGAKAQF